MDNKILFTLIGAVIGYYVKHFLEKRKEMLSEIHKERRKFYQEYIDLIIDLFGASKLNKSADEVFNVGKLYEFYKKYILYASPKVINAFSDYFQYVYSSNLKEKADDEKNKDKETIIQIKKISRIMLMMRKDLGLSNISLGKDGEKLFRAIITDFDKVMK